MYKLRKVISGWKMPPQSQQEKWCNHLFFKSPEDIIETIEDDLIEDTTLQRPPKTCESLYGSNMKTFQSNMKGKREVQEECSKKKASGGYFNPIHLSNFTKLLQDNHGCLKGRRLSNINYV